MDRYQLNIAMIATAIQSVIGSATKELFINKNGNIKNITVIKYAARVYIDEVNAFSHHSAFVERYSEAHIDMDADIPVINPTTAINLGSCNPNVKPAKTHVSSTKASLSHKTIDQI